MNAPHYWRDSKKRSAWLGRKALVVVSTSIRVAPSGLEELAPYSLVLVEFGNGERAEFLGVGHEIFQPGQEVKCVLRRLPPVSVTGVIPYAIKVTSVSKGSIVHSETIQ